MFIFFWKAIQIAGSAQRKKKAGSVGFAETQVFLGLITIILSGLFGRNSSHCFTHCHHNDLGSFKVPEIWAAENLVEVINVKTQVFASSSVVLLGFVCFGSCS